MKGLSAFKRATRHTELDSQITHLLRRDCKAWPRAVLACCTVVGHKARAESHELALVLVAVAGPYIENLEKACANTNPT